MTGRIPPIALMCIVYRVQCKAFMSIELVYCDYGLTMIATCTTVHFYTFA